MWTQKWELVLERENQLMVMLTLVSLVLGDLLRGVLHLEQELDSLNRGHGGLGDRGGDTAGDKVLGERGSVEWHFAGKWIRVVERWKKSQAGVVNRRNELE